MHSERATQNVFDKSMATCREDTVRTPSKNIGQNDNLRCKIIRQEDKSRLLTPY